MKTVRIDSHQHFWIYSPHDYPWINLGSPLERIWLPSDLEAIQLPLGLDGSIAVQARQTVEESRWLLDQAEANPRILGVVGWVDLRSDRVEEQLAEFCSNRRFVGVRHVVQDEPDDRFLLGPEFVRGLKCLQPHGLRYDLLLFPKQLPAAAELVEKLPDQLFVLDHCAKPEIAKGTMETWARDLARLAAHPNVYCKVSGIVTEADWNDWSLETLEPYLSVVEAAFGRQRLMWGSDWPVCLLASTYVRWLETAKRWVSGWSAQEKDAFFGGTTATFYGLELGERP